MINIDKVKTITTNVSAEQKALVETAAAVVGHPTIEYVRIVLMTAACRDVKDFLEYTEGVYPLEREES